MLIRKDLLNKLIELASDSAEYLNEKWITVKPHGEDSKGTHVLVKDGETSKEAVERKFDSKTNPRADARKRYQEALKKLDEAQKAHEKGEISFEKFLKIEAEYKKEHDLFFKAK